MEVFAKYLDIRQTKVNPAMVAIAMAMAGSSPAGVGVDGALPTQSRVATGDGNGLAGLLTGKQQRADAPPAYLNYLFFDKEMNYQYGGYPESLRSRDKLSR
ncbi:hypothetical protein ADIS_1274 [Lunatimonas lonarensis]|uniref:Uncharacterized protein n=1 Tax=Lunatimonas lonarensis TaxID=1232681 RepID=R7ZVG4_9BACT|nr:hypothetical protein ADIS_1274 [Lunatimonas lonarensis]